MWPVISGNVALSISVNGMSSQVILVPLRSDVIGAVAVVVTNVLLDSASMTATTKGPRVVAPSPSTTVTGADPLYLQRAARAETLQVKVTVVPLHTSGPASLDRSTAAEAEGIKFFYAVVFNMWRHWVHMLIDDLKLCSIFSYIITPVVLAQVYDRGSRDMYLATQLSYSI